MKTAIFTICSRNYLAYALTLKKSVEAFEPDCPFFIFLADAPLEGGEAIAANIITAEDLGLPGLASMAFRYTQLEFNTSIKADCFLHLLTRCGFESAIYLDPDIRLYAPMAAVHDALGKGASAVLTPHILGPLPEQAPTDERDILKSGVFNLGFAAFRACEESLSFLDWWAGQLHTRCYSAPAEGLFVDQRFVDFAPGFLDRLHVLRHTGYNVAYWNLPRRPITPAPGGLLAGGAPLVFFHFSGVAPGDRGILSKHLDKDDQEADEAVRTLIHDYQDALAEAGHAAWSQIAYAYGFFRDGSAILPPMRRRPPETGTPEDWFAAPDLAWWNAPDPRITPRKGHVITRLMMGFWDLRPDLQAAFPLGTKAGRRGLQAWFHRHGAREYGLSQDRLSSLEADMRASAQRLMRAIQR